MPRTRVEVLLGHLEKGCAGCPRRVHDHDVDRPELRPRPLEEPLELLDARDVAGEVDRPIAEGDRAASSLRGSRPQTATRAPSGKKQARNGEADAARTAGNDGNLALELAASRA